ncbi:prepilin peptidase [Tumebacillus lipolyticus]|uniref:Prepilin peptidase n=1 Tax=Tumebacillus lipolyticus TaxID=1280370 RepID=A0ABW4ZU11_9BACL
MGASEPTREGVRKGTRLKRERKAGTRIGESLCLLFAVALLPLLLLAVGVSGDAIVRCSLCGLLLILTITDLRSMTIPNRILYPGSLILFSMRLFIHPEPWWQYPLGFICGGLIVTLLGLIANGMGGGDIKLFAVIGMVLGIPGVLLVLFFACLWGSLIGLPLRWSGVIKPRQQIPFGPFILLGTLSAWGGGEELVLQYVQAVS